MEIEGFKSLVKVSYNVFNRLVRRAAGSFSFAIMVSTIFYAICIGLLFASMHISLRLGEIEEERFWKALEFEREIYHSEHAIKFVLSCIKLQERDDPNLNIVCERASSAFYSYSSSNMSEEAKWRIIETKSYEEMLVYLELNIAQIKDRIKQAQFINTSKEIYDLLTSKNFADWYLAVISGLIVLFFVRAHRLGKSTQS